MFVTPSLNLSKREERGVTVIFPAIVYRSSITRSKYCPYWFLIIG